MLDLALPGLDGWQVIERIREFSRVPILIVTARSAEADKVRGLKLGADDYITKPLSFPELLARVEAALRRAATPSPERPRRLRHGELVVDLDDHRARLGRRRPPADADRVPPPRLPRRACRAARDPPGRARRGLGQRATPPTSISSG